METYIIPAPDAVVQPRSRRFGAVLLGAGFSFLLVLANLLIFPRSYLSGNFAGAIVLAGIVGLMLAFARGWGSGRLGKPLPPGDIQVTDETIRRLMPLRFNTLRRTVRKGRIRTICERDMPFDGKGMFLSERSPSWALAFSGVLIPESLPNYRQLCQLAESWRAPQ